jgi:alpha-galactosidase
MVMNSRRLIARSAGLLAAASVGPAFAQAADPLAPTGKWSIETIGSAPTPPMGWNSWNAFGTDVNEAKVLGAAKAIVDTGLAKLGYRYINIDDGWWLKRRQSDGRMLIRTNLFPSAAAKDARHSDFRPFVDRIHKMGLKAGIYTDIGRNACSQAYNLTNPNLPEGTTLEREVGTLGHVDADMKLYFQDWGFDYIKVDACGVSGYGDDRPVVAQAHYRSFKPLIIDANVNLTNIPAVKSLYGQLRATLVRLNPDDDFVFSICNWGTANVRSWGKDYGNLWRTSGDIQSSWARMLHVFDSTSTRELYAGPGHWNDPDMLFIGHGDFDINHLTEAKSHFALWAIEASPLIIGYDLRDAPKPLLDIWGAKEIVAVNQDKAGNQGVIAYSGDDVQIIVKTLGARGEKAVVLFNRNATPVTVQLTADHLKMARDASISLRDLWAGGPPGSFTGEKDIMLKPHEAMILKAIGKPALATGFYLSEMPARVNVAADGITALEADPTVHRMIQPWVGGTHGSGTRPEYAGWGGPRADSTPYDEAIRIANITYPDGIGALANSRLEVRANGEFARFESVVGIDDSSRSKGQTVTFEVYGDGRLLASSSPMRFGQPAATLAAPVAGIRIVELVARASGINDGPTIVAWGEAALR